MYNCGPTVYDRAHIGNLRSYVFADIVRRTFEYFGYHVHQVINITDIGHLSGDGDAGDDKMTTALKREGLPMTLEAMKTVGDKYFEAFVADLKSMNIELPKEFPRASDHIEGNIEIIGLLDEKGYIYKTSDGMYYDTSKFPNYGKLGNIDIASLRAGARVEVNSEKRDPTDFALWKFNNEIGWDSPWGKGFPGWHIECSTMSRKYLGQPFDIHTGGIDHIPVHHNNEIAQSEGAFGVPLANYWLHNEFLNVADGKMAKSQGNFVTLETLRDETISPIAYRYWLLTAHYRSPINFSLEAVRASQNALIRLMSHICNITEAGNIVPSYKEQFDMYISDDFDTPKAIAVVWDIMKDENVSLGDKRTTILDFDRVLGLGLDAIKNTDEPEIPAEIVALAEAREVARNSKDWKQADALRKEMESRGYSIRDDGSGYKILTI